MGFVMGFSIKQSNSHVPTVNAVLRSEKEKYIAYNDLSCSGVMGRLYFGSRMRFYESEGRTFESFRARHFLLKISPEE